jgi:hypothetical protein
MATHSSITRALFPLVLALAVSAIVSAAAPDADPEPPGDPNGESAAPAIDLAKAKADPKLAQQVAINQSLSTRNLRHIGLAVHNYHDAHGRMSADITDKAGKPILSWRVLLLPYLEQDKLYKEFKLDEPWDSKHNKKLLAKMPDVFRSPRVRVRDRSNTVYQVFTGREALFGRGVVARLATISDGTSNTILAVESSTAVPWTKPGGIPFDRAKAVPDIGKAYGKRPLAVMCDGSVRVLDLGKILPETLKNAIDPADGNVLGADWGR